MVAERLGVKFEVSRNKKEPMWKRRLDQQILQFRKDLSRVEQLGLGKKLKKKFVDILQRKYWLKQKGWKVVVEELRQRIKAKSCKVKRYQDRIKQFRKNRLFQTDQGKGYKELNGEEGSDISPDKEEAKEFWSNIWSKETCHNQNSDWLK